ncbi:MAG: insulinase family protein [Bacteroidetes bacterium]|nr:insulinase family protein [Bacteroidota bacterium]
MQIRKILVLFILISNTNIFAQIEPKIVTIGEEIKHSDDGKFSYKTYKNDPLKSRWYTLENGLTVILSPNNITPRVQTLIATKAGSKSDPADNTGLAHYLEHMLFKGTDKYGTLDFEKEKIYLDKIDELYEKYNSETNEIKRKKIYHEIDSVSVIASKYSIANEYDKLVQSIGATGTNAFTSFEQTVYVNDIPSNEISRWLSIEAERFRNPVLRLFHTELEAVYEEKNRTLDNDGRKMFYGLFSNLFKNHNYGLQTTIGTVEHLKNPSLKKIRQYYKTYYVPNNMAIIMSGDFNPDEIIVEIDKKFGYMKPEPVPPYNFMPEMPTSTTTKVDIYGPDAEYLYMGYRFPGAGTRDVTLLQLVDLLLSYKGAGLIDLDLIKSQQVLSASSSVEILKDYSVHFFSGKPKQGQTLADVQNLLIEEINKIKKGDFDYEMVKSIVQNNKVDRMKQFEDNGNRAYTLLDYFILGVNYKTALEVDQLMLGFSKNDIINFANKYYTDDYVVCFKHKGIDTTIKKIDKPEITNVEVNREKTSAFVENILNTPSTKLVPKYINYDKDIEKIKLKNGINAYLVKNEENQLFNLYYVIEAGKYNDLKLAFAVNYLPFIGTSKYTANQIAKEFFKLACSFGVSVGNKQSYIYLSGLTENFEKSVTLFEEFLADAKPDDEALKGLVARTMKGRMDAKQSKNAIFGSALKNYAIYGADNPFRNMLSETELKNIKAQELCDIIHNLVKYEHKVFYYGPELSNKVKNTLDKLHLSSAKKIKLPEAKNYIKRDVKENEVYFVNYDMVQAEIGWYCKLNKVNRSEDPLIGVFNEYFGGGMSSLVFQTIRESKALAYSTYSYYVQGNEPDEFDGVTAYVGTQADKMPEAIPAMNELLNELPKSDLLLSNSKLALKSKIESNRTIGVGILFEFNDAVKWGFKEDQKKYFYENIDKISFDDLNNLHKTRLSGKPYIYFVIGNKDKVNLKELEKTGKLKIVTLEEIFGY